MSITHSIEAMHADLIFRQADTDGGSRTKDSALAQDIYYQ